jgi:hypothetical protein
MSTAFDMGTQFVTWKASLCQSNAVPLTMVYHNW